MNTQPETGEIRRPLRGWRVLVPRGGPWGDQVAALLRTEGAIPVIAPLVNFAPTTEVAELDTALADLAAGAFDWITLTSATTVDVLYAYRAVIPATTRVAAVGETTAAALTAVGYRVDLVPDEDDSAAGLAEQIIDLGAGGFDHQHRPMRVDRFHRAEQRLMLEPLHVELHEVGGQPEIIETNHPARVRHDLQPARVEPPQRILRQPADRLIPIQ